VGALGDVKGLSGGFAFIHGVNEKNPMGSVGLLEKFDASVFCRFGENHIKVVVEFVRALAFLFKIVGASEWFHFLWW
jgi:hypothetical protein